MNREKTDKKTIYFVPNSLGMKVTAALLIVAELGFLYLVVMIDVLPAKMFLLVLFILALVGLGTTLLLATRGNIWKRILGIVLTAFLIFNLVVGSYLIIYTYDTINTISVEKTRPPAGAKLDVTEDSYNIYISGVDFWGDIEEVSRSDVNMIMTINPRTRQVLLTSIPRDAYVTLHSYHQLDKLTHTGIYGIDETTSTVEDWLGIKIDYYARANFNMCMALVNAMDGIDVYSDYEFKSSISKYKYKKGWNYLTGKQALYFARERKSFKASDQQRIKNQQKVVKAMIKKLTGSKAMLTHYTSLLDAVEGYMQTDLSQKEISSLVKMQLGDMKTKWTINSIAIKGHEEMRGTYSMGLGRPLTVNITDEKSVERAVKLINKVQYPKNGKVVKIVDD